MIKIEAKSGREAMRRRMKRLWRRFCRACDVQNIGDPAKRAAMRGTIARINHMRYQLTVERPEGVRFENCLEAADLGLDWELSFPRPLLCDAPPGSRTKVAVLAWRVERGFELFDPADRNCLDNQRD